MSGFVRLAVIQAALPAEREENLAIVIRLLRRAATEGAQVALLPELFDGPYFPRTVDRAHRERALPLEQHPTIECVQPVAAELGLVVPVSFYERDGRRLFNSVAMIDADGSILGVYRKSHIPSGAGYEEKECFDAGDTGFRCWQTRFGVIGVGICWDQWFPEAARAMTLAGADLLLYPSTIGSEPDDPNVDTSGPWRRVMLGHAVANAIPVAASNRVGREGALEFYGSSFVADHRGELVADLGRAKEEIAVVDVDLGAARAYREAWGLLRDRRPELYAALTDNRARDDN
jgi:N-carbamoylputrescine amidase